jgi:cytochrome c553
MARNSVVSGLKNPWPKIGWTSFAIIIITSGLLGFVVLSRYQLNDKPLDIWNAICRGLGITADTSAAAGAQPALRTPTDFAWTRAALAQIDAGNAKHGESVASTCNACHGSAASSSNMFPVLGGMGADAIFKQLADFRSGKRPSPIMDAIAKGLTIQDSADVAAYFSSRTGPLQADSGQRLPEGGRGLRQTDPGERLIFAGDQRRGIAPCSACHGPGGFKAGAPPLAGQRAAYIEQELAAFAKGMRQNDIYETMRSIARKLAPEEMQAVATSYGSHGGEIAASDR